MINKTSIITLLLISLFILACGRTVKPTGDYEKDAAILHEMVLDGKYSDAKRFLEESNAIYGAAQQAWIIEFGVGEENLLKVMNAE